MAMILLCFLACPNVPVDTAPDTGCESEGDIDELRFNMVAETCNWLVFDCGHLEQRNLAACSYHFGEQLSPPVDDGHCVDWCAARTYTQEIRAQDCSLAEPLIEEEFESWPIYLTPVTDPALAHFYECETPNYAPSGP